MNPTTAVGTQPSVVVNRSTAQLQIKVAASFAANLSTTANLTVAVSTVVSAVQPYIPSWRRQHVNPRPTQDHNLNAGGSWLDGIVRTTTSANVTKVGNLLPATNAYLATNAQMGSQFHQAAGAQQNLVHRYSTKWETLQIQKLSEDEEEVKRWQASISERRAALMIKDGDQSNSSPNPNLSAQQANLNPYAQTFALTSVPTALQPCIMPGYELPIPASLY